MRACIAMMALVGWIPPAFACWDEQQASVGRVNVSLSEGHEGSGWNPSMAREALALAFGLSSLPFDSVSLWTEGCDTAACLTICLRERCHEEQLRSLDVVPPSTRTAWVVQVGASTRRRLAEALLATLPQVTSPSPAYRFARNPGSSDEAGIEQRGAHFRVIAGVYATRVDAQLAERTLRRLGHATWVHPLD